MEERAFLRNCTRRLEFDSAHRVMRHESKCKNLHGHRYVVEITAAGALDSLGRVIDFSVLKTAVGSWIDRNWDHGCIGNLEDKHLIALCRANDWKCYLMPNNPTAENMASHLFEVANHILEGSGVCVSHVRLYETPNCWADFGTKSGDHGEKLPG